MYLHILKIHQTLDPMDEKEGKNLDLPNSRSIEMCISIGWDKWDFSTLIFSYFLESLIVQNLIYPVSEYF